MIGAVAASGAQRPHRATPDRVGADMGLDLVGVQAREVVPLLVVLADVLQADPAIVGQAVARTRRTELAAQPAARRFAHPVIGPAGVRRGQWAHAPSGHWANMCSTAQSGKRGERWP